MTPINTDNVVFTETEFKQMAIQRGYEPITYAYWIDAEEIDLNDDLPIYWECSACNTKHRNKTKRCPECGAKMLRDIENGKM